MPPLFLTRALSSISRTFHSPENADRAEWRPIVFSYRPLPLCYRASSWGYSVVGLMLLIYGDAMRRCDDGFWWRFVGSGLCLQGFLSYMSDVHCWGRNDSRARTWKALDPMLATFLTFLVGPVICCRMALGLFSLPAELKRTWTLGVAMCLASKGMGARAARSKDSSCEQLLLWHCGWHGLPLVAAYCILCIANHVDEGQAR